MLHRGNGHPGIIELLGLDWTQLSHAEAIHHTMTSLQL